MPPARKAITLGLLFAAGTVRSALAAPGLELTPCALEHPLRLSVLAAECGVLSVPENPQQPHGRQIGLHIARVGAISRRKQADPLFVLAGGPGAAAGALYASVAPAFAWILRERDIVLVDQRGTGGSNPLDCAEPLDLIGHASDKQIMAATRACSRSCTARLVV